MIKQLLLPILCIFLFSTQLKASHLVGGQIRWECLNNGKYVFYMEIYRECTGIPFSFTNQALQILNSSLPAISMKPDTISYALYDGGNISPKGPNGNQLVCKNSFGGSDLGATQFFPFKSDPVYLNGVPPASGWVFYWTSCCRPSNAVNLSNPASQGYGLRAIMYPYKGKNSSTCYDSSPMFMDNSIATASNNTAYAFSCLAKDVDEDSLSYFFDKPLDASASGSSYMPNPVYYTKGYSHTSPFLDTSTYSIALTAKLDKHSGFIKGGKVFGTSGDIYAYSVRVDSYREGVKIASVWKDAALLILNMGNKSGQPTIHINTASTNSYSTTIELGDSISIPIDIVDTNLYADTNNPGTFRARDMALHYYGEMFSLDYNDENNCQGRLSPCVGIFPAPHYDSIIYNEFVTLDSASINLNLNWSIACDFLTDPSTKKIDSKYVNFVLKLINDQNPPQVNYASIQLKVERYQPEIQQAGNILSVTKADSYIWYYNDSLISNSDSSSITMQASGKYSIEVIKNGCPSKLVSYNLFTVDLADRTWHENIKLYPNPFNQIITIELPSNISKRAILTLRDLSGREIKIKSDFRENRILIDTSEELPSGVYFLNISIDENSNNWKIIKI